MPVAAMAIYSLLHHLSAAICSWLISKSLHWRTFCLGLPCMPLLSDITWLLAAPDAASRLPSCVARLIARTLALIVRLPDPLSWKVAPDIAVHTMLIRQHLESDCKSKLATPLSSSSVRKKRRHHSMRMPASKAKRAHSPNTHLCGFHSGQNSSLLARVLLPMQFHRGESSGVPA